MVSGEPIHRCIVIVFFVRDTANNLCVRVDANNFAVCAAANFQLKKYGREGTRREREHASNANEGRFPSSPKM